MITRVGCRIIGPVSSGQLSIQPLVAILHLVSESVPSPSDCNNVTCNVDVIRYFFRVDRFSGDTELGFVQLRIAGETNVSSSENT